MSTSLPAPAVQAHTTTPSSVERRHPFVAGPVHFVFLFLGLAAWCFYFKVLVDSLIASAHPNRLGLYGMTLLFEWLLFAFAVWGVRRHGAPLSLILGPRWQSAKQVFRDIGIASLFWGAALLILSGVHWLLRVPPQNAAVQAIVPHTPVEIAVWLLDAVTAGICEETLFRGYLQRQFIAFTRSAPAGIIVSALCFGAAHIYQGLRMVVFIAIFGLMFGVLAWWRNSTRPGMIAHGWQDALGGVVTGLSRR